MYKKSPTKKQIDYVNDIIYYIRGKRPEYTQEAYSKFLNKNIFLFNEFKKQRQLDHELEMEIIDARRNW